MLSFDFLIDDVVYGLRPMLGLLLAGMITRADNLGRLPGEPSVLLAYLFYPRAPRPDAGADDVRDLLITLSTLKPAVVAWYWVGNTRFVEFVHWKRHQPGLREHNLRSSFPGPDADSARAVLVPHHGTEALDLDSPPEGESSPPLDLGALVKTVARSHSMDAALGMYDAERVAEWCAHSDAVRQAAPADKSIPQQVGHWLWNSGVANMDVVIAILDEYARLKPANPFAYFAPRSVAREAIVARFHGERQIAEHAKEKAETEQFLEGGAG
jgi:hypothetical protein